MAGAGPVRATLQTAYDEEVAFRARRALVDAAREPDRPFLLVASFTHPHDPYEVPPALWARYDGVEIDGPAVPWLPPEEQDAHSARLARMIGADRPPDEARVLAARRGYYAAISLVDDHVGTLLATLDEVGLADDTIVLITSDHGDLLGERGLWYKMSPLDPSARVPLLVHAPRRFAAGRVAAPVSLLRPGADAGRARGRRPRGGRRSTARACCRCCAATRGRGMATWRWSTWPRACARRR